MTATTTARQTTATAVREGDLVSFRGDPADLFIVTEEAVTARADEMLTAFGRVTRRIPADAIVTRLVLRSAFSGILAVETVAPDRAVWVHDPEPWTMTVWAVNTRNGAALGETTVVVRPGESYFGKADEAVRAMGYEPDGNADGARPYTTDAVQVFVY